MSKKSLNILVEEFFNTGKLKLSEDIEFDVGNEEFGKETEEEIEIYGDENIPQEEIDYIKKEYGWLTDDKKIQSILKNPPFNYKESFVVQPRYTNSFKSKYILTNEIKKGNASVYSKLIFNEFLDKVNKILGSDLKLTQSTFESMTGKNLESTKNQYGLSDEQIEDWKGVKSDIQRGTLFKAKEKKEIERSFNDLKKFLSGINVWEIEDSMTSLLKNFKLYHDDRFLSSNIPDNNETIKKLIDFFEKDEKIKFYLKFISKSFDDNTIRAHWPTFVKYSKAIKEIIDKNKIPDEQTEKTAASTQKYMESLKQYFNKIKKQEYCYIFNDNCKLSSSDIEKVMEFFGETYENSFINKGFKKDSKSVESRIHNLGNVNFSFSEKIKSDDFDVDKISKFIIKNIENYLNEKDSITKYDLLADGDIKDSEGNVIIPDKGKVEVKDINYEDSYLSEFLASPVKKTEYGIRNNPTYLKRYNNVIGKVYNSLKNKWEDDIKEKIKNDLEGIIISNNIYIPNKDENIKFYLSNVGRANPKNQLRIAVRYHINKNNWRNFYKIGDDGILYPLSKEPNISGREVQIYNPTKDQLNTVTENFFDTGNFEF